MKCSEYANLFKALADETRVKIIQMLNNEKMCACKILEKFNITQPTLSYHMKILVNSGIVLLMKQGKWSYYSLNLEMVNNLEIFINNIGKNNTACESEI